jgi:hypothetical protein
LIIPCSSLQETFCSLSPRWERVRVRGIKKDILTFDTEVHLEAISNLKLLLEAVSKIGFWFKVAAEPNFKPEEYSCISRI